MSAQKKIKPEPEETFTGVARSIMCFRDRNKWKNFKIVTLSIENNQVVEVLHSQAYMLAETDDFITKANYETLMRLNHSWGHGKTLEKHPEISWERVRK